MAPSIAAMEVIAPASIAPTIAASAAKQACTCAPTALAIASTSAAASMTKPPSALNAIEAEGFVCAKAKAPVIIAGLARSVWIVAPSTVIPPVSTAQRLLAA